ncbi:MAG: cache domain-containing protein [Bacteroidales bacterium]|nr:cache domain-containing protein [Bacteroidales bacterium]
MKQTTLFRWKFFFRIIFPALAAIILFVIAFYAVILPAYERSIMERKAEMIRELTNSAWSVLQKYHQDEITGVLSPADAQQEAASRIEYLRYGSEGKDYFWITDLHPEMVMHPYRKDLNGMDLSYFTDPRGKRLFVEMVDSATHSSHGEGFVEYMWQWKDDSTQIVPKLSFVKLFKPWGWVIGTGIYLEDVREEINSLERGLLTILLVITLVLSVLFGIIAVQSFRIEQKRMLAEKEIKLSEEKYRTLVEASSDGTMMLLEGEVVYANKILQDLAGFSENEMVEKGLGLLFSNPYLATITDALKETTDESGRAACLEVPMEKKSGDLLAVELVISLMPLGSDFVHVIQIKPLSEDQRKIRLQENLNTDFQTSLLFLSQPVGKLIRTLLTCDMNQSVRHASLVMTQKGYDAILVCTGQEEPVGIITDEDIRKRAVAEGNSPDNPVYQIMSSPLVTIPEKGMLFEAISLMQDLEISHLGVRNQDGKIISIVSNRELLQVHRYSISLIKKQIEKAETWQGVAEIGKRIPELTAALMTAGSDAENLVRFNAVLFDSIMQRFIGLALSQLGEPPVPFVFLVLGSAGREEQTLATDQDNAILFDEVSPDQIASVQSYFIQLGILVSNWLNESGYEFCKGKIMASNPDWCQPISRWKEKFTSWITSSEPQDLLDINIFFDFRPVYGETRLCNDLHNHIQALILSRPSFFIFLTRNIQRLKPPLSLFGNIIVGSSKTRPEAFDIKRVLLPLVDIARLYALKEGIRETSTLNRFMQLLRIGMINENQFDERTEAYKLLMMIRFRHQVEQLSGGKTPDNFINPETISPVELAMLKKVFGQISEFINKVVMDFKGGVTSI